MAQRSVQPPPLGNVVRIGIPRALLADFYHSLLKASWTALLGELFLAYLAINGIFGFVYLAMSSAIEGVRPGSYVDAFFFSVHTFATIGYGSMSPKGFLANATVTVESFIGLISIALVTGLIFAKFSRPTARITFSNHIIVSKRNGIPTLMLRMANERTSTIAEATARVTLLRWETTSEGERMRRLIDLPLVRDNSPMLVLTWTVMSPITAEHPLSGLTAEEIVRENIEFVVTVVGIDETLAQTVHARHRYASTDVRFGRRFVDIMNRALAADTPTFHFSLFHETETEPEDEPERGA